MPFKALLFDMDGTLVDNMGVHSQIWAEFLTTHGVRITADEFYARAAGRTNAEILLQMIGPDLSDDEIVFMAEEKERLYRLYYRPLMQPLDGLPAFLRSARAEGFPMAVASSAGRENIDFHLAGLGLQSWFDATVGSEDVRRGKPNPDLFLTAAERLGVPPNDCLVFEDTPAGLEAARRAGMWAVAFTTSYPAKTLLQNPAVLRVEPDFTGLSPRDFV